MNLLDYIFSPVVLTFYTIAIGLLIGKIKFFNISLNLSAVLLVAVAVGLFISSNQYLINAEQISELKCFFNNISSLGTALFVSIIGISIGYTLTAGGKYRLTSMLVGACMVLSTFSVTYLILQLSPDISSSMCLGILCGALTTTPGLSAICEKNSVIAEDALLGYGISYLFGVLGTVLFVQLLTRKIDVSNRVISNEKPKGQAIFGGFLQISISILLGKFIGEINIPCLEFSLGSTGGILSSGIIVGCFARKSFENRNMSNEYQQTVKNLGLMLFFVGNGVPAGMKLTAGFDFRALILGVLLTVIPLFIGWFICKVLLKKSNNETAVIISGGMTSTPAVAVLSSKISIAYDKYSFAYVGALATIILLSRIV